MSALWHHCAVSAFVHSWMSPDTTEEAVIGILQPPLHSMIILGEIITTILYTLWVRSVIRFSLILYIRKCKNTDTNSNTDIIQHYRDKQRLYGTTNHICWDLFWIHWIILALFWQKSLWDPRKHIRKALYIHCWERDAFIVQIQSSKSSRIIESSLCFFNIIHIANQSHFSLVSTD